MVVFFTMLLGWLVNPELKKKDYVQGVRIGIAELIIEFIFIFLPLYCLF